MSRFPAPDGTSLSFSELGTGPRLVCLPGGPGRASAYLEDLGGLSQERTLVLLDARATGASEVPADPSTLRFDRLAEDVDALREHLGEERIDLLGHSAGAIVAYFVYSLLVPTLTAVLAETQQWFRDLQPWVDFNYTQAALFNGALSNEQWAQLGVTSLAWLVAPLALGLWMLLRSEIK